MSSEKKKTKKKKKPSKGRTIGLTIGILAISTFTFLGIYHFILVPHLFQDQPEPVLIWEGEITDKKVEIDVDHDVYSLEINGTTWFEVDWSQYNKYGISSYVYFVKINEGIYYLLDQYP